MSGLIQIPFIHSQDMLTLANLAIIAVGIFAVTFVLDKVVQKVEKSVAAAANTLK